MKSKKIPIDVICGFLGSGKTTLINALLETAYKGENIAIIENEFGEVDIDSELLPGGIEITKITGGCVCCTLKASLIDGIKGLCERFNLDRIVIETTGVAKLSDVVGATQSDSLAQLVYIGSAITLVGPDFHLKFGDQLGEFYSDQIDNAHIIYMSRKDTADKNVFDEAKRSIMARGGTQRIYDEIGDFAASGEQARGQKRNECKYDENVDKRQGDECKHGENECISEDDEFKRGKNWQDYSGNERKRALSEHKHAESDADDEFYSFVVNVEPLKSGDALHDLIDGIVADNLPNIVFRIKGSVLVDNESKLVQWVSGEMELTDSHVPDSKLVVVVGRG